MTDERERQLIDDAWKAWRDAEEAYRDESGKYVAMWWAGEPAQYPEKVVDHEAIETFDRLRAAVQKAQDDYVEAARRYARR